MHWFSKTINTSSYERFLYFWIAIETLKLESKSNIKPIKTALGRIYPKSKEKFKEIPSKLYGL